MTIERTDVRFRHSIPVDAGTSDIDYNAQYGVDERVIKAEDLRAWAYKEEDNGSQTIHPLELTTDFTVQIVGEDSANVFLVEDASNVLGSLTDKSGLELIIMNCPAGTQEVDLPLTGPFPSTALEKSLDKLTLIANKLAFQTRRAIHLNRFENVEGMVENLAGVEESYDYELSVDNSLRSLPRSIRNADGTYTRNGVHLLEAFKDEEGKIRFTTAPVFDQPEDMGKGHGIDALQTVVHVNEDNIERILEALQIPADGPGSDGTVSDITRNKDTYDQHIQELHRPMSQSEAESPVDDRIAQVTPQRLHQAVHAALPGGTSNDIISGDAGGTRSYSPNVLKDAIAAISSLKILQPGITRGNPRDTAAGTDEVPFQATFEMSGDTGFAGYLDLRNINRVTATSPVPGTPNIESNRTVVINVNNIPLGGSIDIYIRKGTEFGDRITLNVVASEDSTLEITNAIAGGITALRQIGGLVLLSIRRTEADRTSGHIVPFEAGAGGGGNADLGVLINALSETPTISAEDLLPLAHSELLVPKIHFVDPKASLSDPLGYGYLIDDNDYRNAAATRFGSSANTYFIIPSTGLERINAIDLIGGRFGTEATAGRGLSLTDSLGREDLEGALLVSSNKRQVILLTTVDELRVDLKIREGISEATISASHVAQPVAGESLTIRRVGSTDDVPIGGYVFNLTAVQAEQLFDRFRASPPISHVEMHLVSLAAISGGHSVQHLSISIGGVWYEDLNTLSLSAKAVTGETLFDTIAEKAKPLVDASAADLQRQIEAIQGGGAEAPFNMEIASVSVPILTIEDVPDAGQRFDVLIEVNGTRNSPPPIASNLIISINALNMDVHEINGVDVNTPSTEFPLNQGINTIAVSIPSASHGSAVANIERDLRVDFQARRGGAYTNMLHIPIHEVASTIPQRLEGIDHIESGRVTFDTSNSSRVVTPTGIVARDASGASVVAPASARATFSHTSDIPTAIRTLATLAASALQPFTTASHTIPTDSVRLAEWNLRAGDRDFYADRVTVTLTGRVASAISNSPGGLRVGGVYPVLIGADNAGVNRECADATILAIDTTANTIQLGLKRNTYSRGRAGAAFEGVKNQRSSIQQGVTFLLAGRVLLTRSGLSYDFSQAEDVPPGSVHVGDVVVLPTGSAILFYRGRRIEKERPIEFKNTLKFEFVDGSSYRLQGDGVVSVNAVDKRFRRGTLVESTSVTSLLQRMPNSFYDVYWYARESSDELFPRLIEPGKDETGAYVLTDGGDVCVLKTRVGKAGAVGRETYTFTQDYNWFPYHRFNSQAKIPMTYPSSVERIGGSGTSVDDLGSFTVRSEASVVLSRTDNLTASRWNPTIQTLPFFRNIPVVDAPVFQVTSIVADQHRNGFILRNGTTTGEIEMITHRTYDGTFFNTLHQFTTIGDKINFTMARTGIDARQVELDNEKG